MLKNLCYFIAHISLTRLSLNKLLNIKKTNNSSRWPWILSLNLLYQKYLMQSLTSLLYYCAYERRVIYPESISRLYWNY